MKWLTNIKFVGFFLRIYNIFCTFEHLPWLLSFQMRLDANSLVATFA